MTEKKGESLQEQMKNLQGEINKLHSEIDSKKREITKLKNDNTLRLEKINWIQEKVRKMQREKKVLELNDQTLSLGHATSKHSTTTKEIQPQTEIQKPPQQEIQLEKMQMLEFFNQYLDQTNKQMVKFQGNRNKNGERDEYINPYPIINIKYTIEGIEQGESSSFRLDQATTFQNLKELAFYYWNLAPYLRKFDEKDSEIMDELELTDENHAKIELKEKVIEFFTNRGISNISQITLLLQKKKTVRPALNSLQIESIRINGGNKTASYQGSFAVHKNRIKAIDTYNLFFEKFPGLKYYISELQIQKEFQEQQKQLEKGNIEKPKEQNFDLDDMNCLIISSIIVILVLTLLSYNAYLSPKFVNLNFTFINNLIGITSNGEYNKITSIPELYYYMENFLGATMYNSDKGDNPFRSNYEIIGGIQLRTLRSDLYECEKYVNELQRFSCFDIIYDSSKANKSKFLNYTYKTAEELGIKYFPKGNLTTYTDGGYMVEFNRDISTEAFLEKINDLRKEQFLDAATAVIFIHFVIYNPSINLWIQANFLLERNAQNKLTPYRAELTGFIPNIYYGDDGQRLFQIDITKLIMASILLAFVAYRFYKIKINTGKLGPAFLYITMEIGFFNCGVGILTIISVAMSLQQSLQGRDPQELVNSAEFVHLELEADLYKKAELFLTISIMFLFLRLSYVLKLNDRVAIIFLTYSKSFKELLPFLAIEFPLFLGFVMVFQIIYGNVFPQYSSFTLAIASQLTMIQGQLNITQFVNYSPIVSMIVILFYYFFMLFFIISLFQAILIECFRIVIMKNGYPQDKDQGLSIGDLFSWMFSWTQLFISKKNTTEEKQQAQQQSKPPVDQEEKQGINSATEN
ncbi:unnamed protein product [Paramecium pentaurelia]|uniref:Uncharacterized protein n=1 Tax=Paramecium pentaurelia TaxID=43138 RepID=A0A8S1TAC2_9CILI|nr:unnamed protein product [Paramecium pentaurelia]